MTPATSQDRQQEQAFPFPQHIVTRRKSFGRSFQVGDKIEAEDSQKKWYPARILQVDEQDSCVLIHFDGFNARYDEWIEMASPKLRLPVRRGRDKTTLLHLRTGEAVLARWTDGKFYPARITEISDESYRVEFYDGYSRTLSPNHIRPVDASRIQSHSRSSSGRSSGETGNTPTFTGKTSHRRSRTSSVLSSAATTPVNSPVSPAGDRNGEHTPPNGRSHPIHQTLRLSRGSIGSDIQHSSGDLLSFRCSTVVSSCGMSSTPVLGWQDSEAQSSSEPQPVVNGGSHKKPESSSPPRGLNGSTVHGHLGTGISHHVAAAASVYPAESRLIGTCSTAAAAAVTTHNGFHTNSVSTRTAPAVAAPAMCPYEPSSAAAEALCEFSDDMVTPIITPPTLPDFTPLSPNSSPRRQPIAPVSLATSVSPLAGCAVSTANTSAVTAGCALASCPSPSSDGVMSSEPLPYHPVCRPTATIASPTSAAPTSVVTPNDSPVVPATSSSFTRSMPSVLPVTAAGDVSQASAANSRHHEAPPPMSSRRRTDSETSNSGRPKRKKVDGVLAPPPAKIAPKEVIAVEDHNPYKCKVCDKSFRKWPLVESHYKHYHPDNQRDFALAKKEYEKRPALAAVVTPDVDQSLKMALKKRTTAAASKAAVSVAAASASHSTTDVASVRQRSSSVTQTKRKEAQDGMVLRQSSAPAVLVGDLAVSAGVSTQSRQLSSPASASSAPPASVAPARAKRKASSADGLPAKRGRPPLSLSAEHTPRLPVVLGAQSGMSSSASGAHSKSGAGSRELPTRLPGKSSRRSLSFSSDVAKDELSPESEIPMVKTDGGFVDLPPDALLCCPCRQETFQAVHVKCTGCRTYQHLMCLQSSSIRQSWSMYQCRTCTHPPGKRRGARDKLPVDWYTSHSLCRNPMPLLAPPESLRSPGIKPFLAGFRADARSGADLSVTREMIQRDEKSCILASKLVDLQHSASQDVLAVGEVLSATMKQLEVITHPDKFSNRAAINRLLPPRVKSDSLVSPIRIKTEPFGGGGIVQSTQSLTPTFGGRDIARDPRVMKASGLVAASQGRSPVISPDQVDAKGPSTVHPLTSVFPSSGRAGSPLAGSPIPSIQQLVDGHGLSHPPSVCPPVTTTRPVSPTVVSHSRMVVSPQSAVSGAAASMRHSSESPLLGHGPAAALPLPLAKQQVLSTSAASTSMSPAQQQQHAVMSPRVSTGRGSPMPMDVDAPVPKPYGMAAGLRDAKEFDDISNIAHDPRLFSPIGRSASSTSLQPQLASSAVRSPVQSQAKSSTQSAAEGSGKGKRSAAMESEDEKNFRVQAARTELLSRVHDIHAAVGNRLTLLEELLGDLESLEENFRCQGPLGCDMSKQQQLAVFQNLLKSVDELDHIAPP